MRIKSDSDLESLSTARAVAFPNMVEVDLDATAKDILLATLASPKTPAELSRIFGLSGSVVVDYLELLERFGLVRVVLSYFGRDGRIIRYYEADLPIDTSDLEVEEPVTP